MSDKATLLREGSEAFDELRRTIEDPLLDVIGVWLFALVLVLQYARRGAPARLPA